MRRRIAEKPDQKIRGQSLDWGLGFRLEGLGFRVWGLGLEIIKGSGPGKV